MFILLHAPLLHALLAGVYLALAARAWIEAGQPLRNPAAATPAVDLAGVRGHEHLHWIERGLLLVAWTLHGGLLYHDIYGGEGIRLGFAAVLSATLWLAVALYWIESLFFGLAGMRLLLLPLAALCVLLPLWFPGGTALPGTNGVARGGAAFDAHLFVALAAYGMLTIAALHALLMAALDRWLHRMERADGAPGGWWARLERAVLSQLPPLLTMERLLFRLLTVGFVLLTLTVATGVVFSETLFGRPLTLDHKVVFSLIAWAIFGGLLIGRAVWGWRGRVALRWTLTGFAMMFLSYVGSRFVLEVILHRF